MPLIRTDFYAGKWWNTNGSSSIRWTGSATARAQHFTAWRR
jgi:hypothetical protein